MNTIAIIVMILIVLMLIVLVSWFFDKSKKISGFRDATKQKTVVNKISTGNDYSGAYAIWIHVSDWSTYNGREKVIFNAGGESGLEVSLGATSPELMAEDMRLAARSLGRITGRVDVEDLLDVIFKEFCIGK